MNELDLSKCTVKRAEGKKCPRCGLYHTLPFNYDNLCDRCCRVLLEDWPGHESIQGIKDTYALQRQLTKSEWATLRSGTEVERKLL